MKYSYHLPEEMDKTVAPPGMTFQPINQLSQ